MLPEHTAFLHPKKLVWLQEEVSVALVLGGRHLMHSSGVHLLRHSPTCLLVQHP